MTEEKQTFWKFGWTRIYPIIALLGAFFLGCWFYYPKTYLDWVWYFITIVVYGWNIAIWYAWVTDYKQYLIWWNAKNKK